LPSWSSCSGVTPRWAASWADPRPSRLSLPDSLSACGSPTLESQPWRPTVSSSQASKLNGIQKTIQLLPTSGAKETPQIYYTVIPHLTEKSPTFVLQIFVRSVKHVKDRGRHRFRIQAAGKSSHSVTTKTPTSIPC